MNQRLPKRIQQELETAAAIEAQMATPAAPPELAVVVEIPPLTLEPVAPAPEPAPIAQPSAQAKSDAHWEQRLRTVQGMHDKVVRDLTSAMSAVQAQVQELKAKPQETPRPSVDPKDVDAFGADMIEMVNKQAERVFAAMSQQVAALTTALDTRMQAIEDRFNGVAHQAESTREEAFYTTLASAVPNWSEINSDPAWLEWLAVIDPVHKKSRQDALTNAHTSRDPQQAIAIFKAFIDSLPKPRATPSLATQVAPSNSGASQVPAAPAAKRIIGQQEIARFYNDVARGLYRSRPDEEKRMEAEINLALEEGRVR